LEGAPNAENFAALFVNNSIMKKNLLYLLSLAVYSFFSCKKEDIQAPQPPVTVPSKLEIVWQRAVSPDTTRRWVHVHAMKNEKVLYSSSFALLAATLHVRNSITGTHLWTYNDWRYPPTELYLTSNVFAYDNDVIMVEDNGDVYAINYNTGETFWY